MRYFLILPIILFFSCGKGPNTIDPTLQPLYNQFISDANSYGLNLDPEQGMTIKFGVLDPTIMGQCDHEGYGNANVTISITDWNLVDTSKTILAGGVLFYLQQYVAVYHELGHCVLDEKHSTNPQDIMYPDNIDILVPTALPNLFHNMGNAG